MKKSVLITSLFALLATLLAFMFFGQRGLIQLQLLQRELKTIQAQNIAVIHDNKQLRLEIDRLKQDMAYIEEIARRELGLVKENETVYHLNENKSGH